MSVSFEIASSVKNYQVQIVEHLPRNTNASTKQNYVLIDAYVLELYPFLLNERCIAIPATEESKTLEIVGSVIEQLRALGASRKSHLVAIGGGVIQDVATFVASIYMRGISWTYYPTTLLGMVDSCLGGKSSINVGQYKNIAGNFYPPDEIFIHTEFCTTLLKDEVIAGLCEAVKICFASKDDAFEQFLNIAQTDGNVHQTHLAQAISLTLKTKKRFIEEDEFDQDIRLLLNFGHTFGHAIESASHFAITHGVAVGLGMLMAIDFSMKLNPLLINNIRVQSLFDYVKLVLSNISTLNQDLKQLSSANAFEKFKSDKKHQKDEFVIIIPDENGYLYRQFIPINDQSAQNLKASFDFIKAFYEV